jgi:hypothetical protein
MRLYGMRRKGQWSVVKNLALYDCSSCLIGSALQPFAHSNQPLGVVRLFGGTGAILHDAQGQRRHITVEPG